MIYEAKLLDEFFQFYMRREPVYLHVCLYIPMEIMI